jgi:hypothetical protein
MKVLRYVGSVLECILGCIINVLDTDSGRDLSSSQQGSLKLGL